MIKVIYKDCRYLSLRGFVSPVFTMPTIIHLLFTAKQLAITSTNQIGERLYTYTIRAHAKLQNLVTEQHQEQSHVHWFLKRYQTEHITTKSPKPLKIIFTTSMPLKTSFILASPTYNLPTTIFTKYPCSNVPRLNFFHSHTTKSKWSHELNWAYDQIIKPTHRTRSCYQLDNIV